MNDDSLGLLLKLISNAQKKVVDNEMKETGITMMQGMILGYLTLSPEKVSQVDIERKFDLTHPTVSGILKRLEQNGFVVFYEDTEDKRKKLVRITEKAQKLREDVRIHQREMDKRLSNGFSEEELATLRSMLERVLDNLSED